MKATRSGEKKTGRRGDGGVTGWYKITGERGPRGRGSSRRGVMRADKLKERDYSSGGGWGHRAWINYDLRASEGGG